MHTYLLILRKNSDPISFIPETIWNRNILSTIHVLKHITDMPTTKYNLS